MRRLLLLLGLLLAVAAVEWDEISLISGKGLVPKSEARLQNSAGVVDATYAPAAKADRSLVDTTDEISLLSGKGIVSKRQFRNPSTLLVKKEGNTPVEKPYQKSTLMHKLGSFLASKLRMEKPLNDLAYKEKCKGAPSMITALLLQIFLGWTGAGFGYMGRWDYFAMMLCLLFAPCILCCIAVCFTREDKGDRESIFRGCGACAAMLASCSGCASFAVQLWSIIMIANFSIKCGGEYSGCNLTDGHGNN